MLVHVALDPFSADATIQQEQKIIIHDMLLDNVFAPHGQTGDYHLVMSVRDAGVYFDVSTPDTTAVLTHSIPVALLSQTLEDYKLICESYRNAARTMSPDRIEAIDMGRRGIHDQGGTELSDALDDKIDLDKATARRLFSLVSTMVNTF